jgi:hypothetical protein
VSERIVRRPRRYSVTGENDAGDMFSYHTDDTERAHHMETMMRETMHKVDLVDRDRS